MNRAEASAELPRNPGPRPTQGTELPGPSGVHRSARPSDAFTSCPGRGDAGTHAFSNQLTLKLGDARENAEDQPAIRRRSVHAFV
jgi:hypothetical protein